MKFSVAPHPFQRHPFNFRFLNECVVVSHFVFVCLLVNFRYLHTEKCTNRVQLLLSHTQHIRAQNSKKARRGKSPAL